MSKYSSANFEVFLVDGYDLLPAKSQGVTQKITNVVEGKTHGLGDKWAASSAVGLLQGTFTQTGAFFEDAVGSLHDGFKAVTLAVRLLVFAMAGNIIGKRFCGLSGVYEGAYAVIAKVAGLALADAEYVVTGQVDRGTIIQNWTPKTISWNTFTDGFPVDVTLDPDNLAIPITSNSIANPTVLLFPVPHKLTTGDVILISGVTGSTPTINGSQVVTVIDALHVSVPVNVTIAGTGGSFVRASSNNGGVGYLMSSAFSGFSSVAIKVRSSADDVTYADLITFAPVTAAPPDPSVAQRVTVAGVIGRYLCVSGTVTGTGSITPFVGVARNAPQ